MTMKSTKLRKLSARNLLKSGIAMAIASLGALSTSAPSKAATVTLGLKASYPKAAPFGMAFGDGFLWWQSSSNVINQMTLSGIDTGSTAINPLGWSALGWDSGQLVAAQNTNVTYFSPSTSAISKTTTITEPVTGILGLIDGLDIGPGGEIWYSPDVGNVYRLTADGTASIPSGVNPFLGGGGGYSGVERIDVTAGTFVLVVNDASSPRRLCIHELSGSEIGCTAFNNQRYEDLAYDGQYLWAADFFGNKIDKFCVQIDGGNCLGDPPPPTNVPGPLPLLGAAVALGYSRKLRQRVRFGHAEETPFS
jgi:hypothetical protein